MKGRRAKMKSFLTICLLLIATAAIASGERKTVSSARKTEGSRQTAVGRIETRPSHTSLTRAQTNATRAQTRLTRAQTREAERRLSEMRYWTGAVDGVFDPATRMALIAFQKWEGRAVTGRLTLDELEAIRNSASPTARETGYAHVEVDLDRQVLLIVSNNGGMVNDDGGLVNDGSRIGNNHGGTVNDNRGTVNDNIHQDGAASYVGRRDGRGGTVRVLPISSGSGKPFMDEGQQSIAHTPRGRFLVYDKVEGWEQGQFRGMYYSNYISGGVAIHGYESVPNQAASHGCIRIPLFAAREVSKLLPIGTIVLVYDKVSFVSGKPWAENPKLKQAILDWNRAVVN